MDNRYWDLIIPIAFSAIGKEGFALFGNLNGVVKMDRPTGVTILAILAFLNGLIAILGAVTVLYFGIGTGLGIISIILLALGILAIVYGWGLWTLKPWAWILAIVGSILNLAIYVISAASSGDFTSNLLSAIINVVIIWYLFRPEVKSAFGR